LQEVFEFEFIFLLSFYPSFFHKSLLLGVDKLFQYKEDELYYIFKNLEIQKKKEKRKKKKKKKKKKKEKW